MTELHSEPPPAAENALLQTAHLDLTSSELRALQKLHDFLLQHDCQVGLILLGSGNGTWKARDMRRLESLIAKEIGDPATIRRLLLVLRKVVSAWAMRHLHALAFPRIPVLPRYARNPISSDFAHLLCRYREWQRWLDRWLGDDSWKNPDRYRPIATPVPVVASAILYGGLCSIPSIVALVRAMQDVLARASASNRELFVDLHLTLPRTSVTEYRAWQPDPVTICLLLRTDPIAVHSLLAPPDPTLPDSAPSDREIADRLKELFRNTLRDHPIKNIKCHLGGIHALLEAARTVASVQLPPLIASYARREIVSYSVPMETIRRIAGLDWYDNPFYAHEKATHTSFQSSLRPDVRLSAAESIPDWVTALRSATRGKTRQQLRAEFTVLVGDSSHTPLERRIVDFALALLTQRNQSDNLRSLHSLRNTVLEVAISISPFLPDGNDPAELSSEQLEQMYALALLSRAGDTDSTSRKFRVTAALREFDRYLRSRFDTPARKQSVLSLGPMEVLGAVDANFLAPSEYAQVLERIDQDFKLRRNPQRLKMVRLLVILGYRCGLRRLEALHMKICDLLFSDIEDVASNAELLVRPSESHRLKSSNAKRRLPLHILLTQAEMAELKAWYEERIRQRGVQPSDYLFGNRDSHEDLEVLPQTVFEAIHAILQEVTRTRDAASPVHFHHLRHGFCTFNLLRLMLSGTPDHPDVLRSFPWLTVMLQEPIAENLYRHRLPTRKHAYLIASLMGHGSPSTSMIYTHCLSWLLPVFLTRSTLMRPNPETLALATGVSAKTRKRWAEQANSEPPWKHLWDWRIRNHAPLIASKAIHRPEEVPLTTSWIELTERFLHEMDAPQQTVAGTASVCGVDPKLAEAWLQRADLLRELRSSTGDLRHRFEPLADSDQGVTGYCPRRPLHRTELDILARYAPLLEQMATDPARASLLRNALSAYVHAVWLTRDYALFHHPETDGPRARYLLDLLLALNLPLRDIGFLRFQPPSGDGWSRRWRQSLGLTAYVRFEIRKPPNPDAPSTASWLAIEPRFHFREAPSVKSPGLAGFRYLLILGYIAFGTSPKQGK